ncbi:hypothetical protein [Vibrio parahaemolyticus]|uniref:hypothetical protein n=1 Tax=Vibrio parahaemolyticus TaxID=670 RepID=UPI0021D1936D|nr:hypothetical protein [Vibrio parahaemolyticus]EGQ8547943.1 hypothetical protein [Vibrio parahaemolyticus]EJC6974884.1 hypothetical protein [Vibrio parahaemolyticus]EJC7127772.1 hypothetical protein [Vibrio parahaemolyticus]
MKHDATTPQTINAISVLTQEEWEAIKNNFGFTEMTFSEGKGTALSLAPRSGMSMHPLWDARAKQND